MTLEKEKSDSKNLKIPRSALIALVIGVLFLAALMLISKKPNTNANPSTAPQLTMFDLNGSKVSLDDYKGQVIIVNNFAVWCPPCKAEIPELEQYYQENKNKGLTIIAIEAGQPLDMVQYFVKEMGISFPVWLDPQMESLKTFRLNGLPNSIVIDRKGFIRQTWVGAVDKKFLEKQVSPLLEE